jgi:hypothetical protein
VERALERWSAGIKRVADSSAATYGHHYLLSARALPGGPRRWTSDAIRRIVCLSMRTVRMFVDQFVRCRVAIRHGGQLSPDWELEQARRLDNHGAINSTTEQDSGGALLSSKGQSDRGCGIHRWRNRRQSASPADGLSRPTSRSVALKREAPSID